MHNIGFLNLIHCLLKEAVMVRNLWALLCFLTYDSVLTMESKTDKKELWKLANAHFISLYTSTMGDMEYFQDNLLAWMPDHTLPGKHLLNLQFNIVDLLLSAFLDVEIDKKRQKPQARFLKNTFLKGCSNEEILFLHFGNMVLRKAEEVVAEIKNRVNALWLPPSRLPSGCSPSGQLTALRERFWMMEALKRARASQASFLYRNRDEEGTAAEKLRMRHENLEREVDPAWYPEWWLTFVLCGKPAMSRGRLSLNGCIGPDRDDKGMFATVEQGKQHSPLKQLHAKGSRATRKALSSMGIAIGHAGGDEPLLKRARTKGAVGLTDLTEDDSVSLTSSSSRSVVITHRVEMVQRMEDPQSWKSKLEMVEKLRELTKERIERAEDPEIKKALQEKELELMERQSHILEEILGKNEP